MNDELCRTIGQDAYEAYHNQRSENPGYPWRVERFPWHKADRHQRPAWEAAAKAVAETMQDRLDRIAELIAEGRMVGASDDWTLNAIERIARNEVGQ